MTYMGLRALVSIGVAIALAAAPIALWLTDVIGVMQFLALLGACVIAGVAAYPCPHRTRVWDRTEDVTYLVCADCGHRRKAL